MELKRRVRQAIELAVFVSALPLLLLGCGGGGGATSTDPNAGRVYGQFWTDLTGTGIRLFEAGFNPASPALGYVLTGAFSGGNYATSEADLRLRTAGWESSESPYYLTASGWVAYPNLTVTAVSPTRFTFSVFGNYTGTTDIVTTDLSGSSVVASSAVYSVTSLGYISAVSPATIVYPAGSYQYDMTTTGVFSETFYGMHGVPYYQVTTKTGTANPINQLANFTDAGFAAHNTKSDPICFLSYGLVHSSGSTYNVYTLVPDAALGADEWANCQNSSIPGAAAAIGTLDLSRMTVNGTPIFQFTGGSGTFGGGWATASHPYSHLLFGLMTSQSKVYMGWITPAGSSSSTDHYLNKTAMDAALTAWGVPTF